MELYIGQDRALWDKKRTDSILKQMRKVYFLPHSKPFMRIISLFDVNWKKKSF